LFNINNSFETLTEYTENCMNCANVIVQMLHKERSNRKVRFIFDLLEYLMVKEVIPYKIIIDQLQCQELTMKRKFIWCQTYKVIKKHINKLDYKGCRDVLRSMIVKTAEMPAAEWVHFDEQINVYSELLKRILDQNSLLIPGYLAISEIRRQMTDESKVPWVVQGTLSKFIDRFRTLTMIAHMTEKWRILPVVHHASSLQTSTWRLDPELKIVNLNKQLPYSKEMTGRQSKLFQHLLKQGYSQEFTVKVDDRETV